MAYSSSKLNKRPTKRSCNTIGISHFVKHVRLQVLQCVNTRDMLNGDIPSHYRCKCLMQHILSQPPERLMCRRKRSLSIYMYTHIHGASLDFRNRVIHQALHDASCHPKEKAKAFRFVRQLQKTTQASAHSSFVFVSPFATNQKLDFHSTTKLHPQMKEKPTIFNISIST